MSQAIERYEVRDPETNGIGAALVKASGGDIFKLGDVLYQSGYFSDVKSAAQAIVKVLRGQELGIGPIGAMENIYVVQGKTALSYPLIGGLIKRSGRYDYRVIEETDDACELEFFEGGKPIGHSRFTKADAKAAGLLGNSGWQKYPGVMLFARAMSQGARKYTPDVFGGAIYTPEELRDIPELEPAPVQETSAPVQEPARSKRPRTRDELVTRYAEICDEAAMWNEDPVNETVEFHTYSEQWTDDELKAYGLALSSELDRVKKAIA